ncbi:MULTISPECIES: hypothetical protein [Calothrix]|uniref:Uncharacterized protein n=2 Tax=Calothrix TaxID=1186 RepID=A0ABR8AJE6_9CYAN|nr:MULTISPECIES: hypothetical protein [Calothrix]MBD2200142.1 hypothetical protein [Calothrix parietina FACHB-288]MBD2229115.1 hypothetical protein [Calothrix anomala FACHB-343]
MKLIKLEPKVHKFDDLTLIESPNIGIIRHNDFNIVPKAPYYMGVVQFLTTVIYGSKDCICLSPDEFESNVHSRKKYGKLHYDSPYYFISTVNIQEPNTFKIPYLIYNGDYSELINAYREIATDEYYHNKFNEQYSLGVYYPIEKTSEE